jgi:hypothetical protein
MSWKLEVTMRPDGALGLPLRLSDGREPEAPFADLRAAGNEAMLVLTVWNSGESVRAFGGIPPSL